MLLFFELQNITFFFFFFFLNDPPPPEISPFPPPAPLPSSPHRLSRCQALGAAHDQPVTRRQCPAYLHRVLDAHARDDVELLHGIGARDTQHIGMILPDRSEEHTSELQSPCNLVCRLLLEKK